MLLRHILIDIFAVLLVLMDDDHFGDVIRLEEVNAVYGFEGGAYSGEVHHCSFVLLTVDSDFQGNSTTDVSSLSIQIHLY